MLYRYFGLKTVQMKRCVRSIVHAAMTEKRLPATKTVSRDRCESITPPGFDSDASAVDFESGIGAALNLCSRKSNKFVALVQNTGPAQLEMNVRIPTARTLYPLTPLYALDRSMEEMAFEPPKAKKDACCRSKLVVVISIWERLRSSRR